MELHGGEMHASSRVAILGRYRRYSDLRKEIQSAALGNVSESSFLAHAKRIGLSDGRVIFADDDSEVALVYDLALYTAQPGRTRAIDRCARKRLTAAQPDEALVLQALQASRFSIFRVIGRGEPAGVLLEDLMRGGTIPLLDEGLERSARPGEVFAMRVAPIEDFVITCGVVVPFIERTLSVQFLDKSVYYISEVPSDLQRADIVLIAAIALLLALLATLYPSWRAAKVNPAEALRYE